MAPTAIPLNGVDRSSAALHLLKQIPALNSKKGSGGISSQEAMALEDRYGARNYHPLPICFDRAEGCRVWDPEVNALITQASRLTLSSRAFHHSLLGKYEQSITKLFGYDKVLPMNTGVEAVETALKLSRKWAYEVKKVEPDQAMIFTAAGNFHGRTLGVISMSTDPEATTNFGPFLPNVGPRCPASLDDQERLIRYNHAEDIEYALDLHGKKTAAVLLEPIQGEAGVVVPGEDYLKRVAAACKKHNVLLIIDEIQTGFGRTGKLLCHHHFGVRADIVTLGKALGGGVFPVSAVLADAHIMDVITPGTHGSTFGGNPLACAVAMASMEVLQEEKLAQKAEEMGSLMRAKLEKLKSIGESSPGKGDGWITLVRGLGLLNAIVIDPTKSTKGRGAWQLCLLMKSKGLLAKPTHVNIVRLAPPLIITKKEVLQAVKIIKESLEELDELAEIPGETQAGSH